MAKTTERPEDPHGWVSVDDRMPAWASTSRDLVASARDVMASIAAEMRSNGETEDAERADATIRTMNRLLSLPTPGPQTSTGGE